MWNKKTLALALFVGSCAAQDRTFTASNGEQVTVHNTTPPGQPHRSSSIQVGPVNFYPAPIPSLSFYQQTFPDRQPPAEIESDIGPYVFRGDVIWFAATFYDGEGTSGIGAIGSFDILSRHYEMRYLPEIAPWSGSAILLDSDTLWIGLKQRPEGPDLPGGVLEYNIATGSVRRFELLDLIEGFMSKNRVIEAASKHHLYLLRGETFTELQPIAK